MEEVFCLLRLTPPPPPPTPIQQKRLDTPEGLGESKSKRFKGKYGPKLEFLKGWGRGSSEKIPSEGKVCILSLSGSTHAQRLKKTNSYNTGKARQISVIRFGKYILGSNIWKGTNLLKKKG